MYQIECSVEGVFIRVKLTAKFVAARVDNFLKGIRGLELGSFVPR